MPVRTGRGRSGWPGSWTDAGYTVELDVWDWPAGQNFMLAMSDALARVRPGAGAVLRGVLRAAPVHHRGVDGGAGACAGTGQGRLVPVRVENVPLRRTCPRCCGR